MMASVPGAPAGARHKLGMFEETAVNCLSLRQLRDAVQNLQFHWVGLSVPETMQPQIVGVVDALFHRCE